MVVCNRSWHLGDAAAAMGHRWPSIERAVPSQHFLVGLSSGSQTRRVEPKGTDSINTQPALQPQTAAAVAAAACDGGSEWRRRRSLCHLCVAPAAAQESAMPMPLTPAAAARPPPPRRLSRTRGKRWEDRLEQARAGGTEGWTGPRRSITGRRPGRRRPGPRAVGEHQGGGADLPAGDGIVMALLRRPAERAVDGFRLCRPEPFPRAPGRPRHTRLLPDSFLPPTANGQVGARAHRRLPQLGTCRKEHLVGGRRVGGGGGRVAPSAGRGPPTGTRLPAPLCACRVAPPYGPGPSPAASKSMSEAGTRRMQSDAGGAVAGSSVSGSSSESLPAPSAQAAPGVGPAAAVRVRREGRPVTLTVGCASASRRRALRMRSEARLACKSGPRLRAACSRVIACQA